MKRVLWLEFRALELDNNQHIRFIMKSIGSITFRSSCSIKLADYWKFKFSLVIIIKFLHFSIFDYACKYCSYICKYAICMCNQKLKNAKI